MGDLSRIAAEILLSLQPFMAGAQVQPPPMVAVEPRVLQMRVCGRPCRVLAWYSPDGTIHIDNRLDIETRMTHRSIVVHELVHHVQRARLGSAAKDCDDWLAREREAYLAQARWLRSMGLGAGNIGLQLRLLRCGARQADSAPAAGPGHDAILATHSD
jgi:hypothetical protein